MIDYIKLSFNSIEFAHELHQNQFLQIKKIAEVPTTGNIYHCYTFRGLNFKVYSTGYIQMAGSLHKFYNGGRHNHNDFTYNGLVRTIQELSDCLGEPIVNFCVHNIEFGLNLHLKESPKNIIDSLITYQSKGFYNPNPITIGDNRGFEKGKRFDLTQYSLKIYDKSQMYSDAQPNIIRIELKFKKMERIKRIGFNTLLDFTQTEKLDEMMNLLLKSLDGCIFNENILSDSLTIKEQLDYKDYINPDYWVGLSSCYQRNLSKKRFEILNNKFGLKQTKALISKLLHDKYMALIYDYD
jgi:hypothetical protein